MNLKRVAKSLVKWVQKNSILFVFGLIVIFVALIGLLKLASSESEYVYVKVKVSQGLWWASSQKPSRWFTEAIKIGEKEISLTGKPIAEILDVRIFPWWSSDQYDVFITLRLEVDKNEKLNSYTYKREPLAIASPVDFEFPSTHVSSTVMAISSEPFEEKYVEKIVTLSKNFAYTWEHDAITIGDTFFDGAETLVEILDKSSIPTSYLSLDPYNYYTGVAEQRRNVKVKMKIKLKEVASGLIFGEEQSLKVGRTINIATKNFYFSEYAVEKIE